MPNTSIRSLLPDTLSLKIRKFFTSAPVFLGLPKQIIIHFPKEFSFFNRALILFYTFFMKSIVILISGSGSNMAAIIKAAETQHWEKKLQAKIVAVISNRPEAKGLKIAQEAGIATHVVDHKAYKERSDFEQDLLKIVQGYQPDLIVLAGFMRILSGSFTARFPQKIINIHPSLLPAFPGLHTHERALQMGCRFAGATVHWVIEELDAGSIIDQAIVPILQGDTSEVLAARVLSQEHLMYPKVIAKLLSTEQV